MKKICEVNPLLFDGYLILSLDGKWIDVFGEMPTFEASLDDYGKLHLTSTKSVYKKKCGILKKERKSIDVKTINQ